MEAQSQIVDLYGKRENIRISPKIVLCAKCARFSEHENR